MLLRSLVPAAVLALLVLAAPAQAGELACTSTSPGSVQRLDTSVGGQPTYGSFAAPTAAPRVLAMYGHGFTFNVDGWRPHLTRTASRLGTLAIAMNYRGLKDLPPGPGYPYERSRGYPVKAGSEDLVAAAQQALRRCPSIRHVVLLGISMGGNATGMTAALGAKRDDGRPLFDYWVGVEGVYNLIELYQGARAVAPANEFAGFAKADIEAETGGTPETKPGEYASRSVVTLAPQIAASGLKGVVLVHGREDGLAPFNQAQELLRRLRAEGLPTDLFSVGARGPDDDPDTTFGSYAGADTGGAGHGPEVSENHIVIDTGFDRVAALIARGDPAPCNRDFDVDGTRSPTVTPDPAEPTAACPRMAPLGAGGGAAPGTGAGGGPGAGGSAGLPGAAGCTAAPAIAALRARRGGRGTRSLTVTGHVRSRRCAGRALRARVEVAVLVRSGRRCRAVRASGRLGARRSCRSASGARRLRTTRRGRLTTFTLRARAPRGARLVLVTRAADTRGRGPSRRKAVSSASA